MQDRTREVSEKLLIGAAILGVFFVALSVLVVSGQTQTLDDSIIQYIYSLAQNVPNIIMRALDFSGSIGVFVIIIPAIVYLTIRHRVMGAVTLVICLIGAEAIVGLLKLVFHRPRPIISPEVGSLITYSFPSGHALISIAFYGLLGLLLTEDIASGTKKLIIRSLFFLFALLIGVSRILAGLHWPTDVLAGFFLGGAWLLLCIALLFYLRRLFGR